MIVFPDRFTKTNRKLNSTRTALELFLSLYRDKYKMPNERLFVWFEVRKILVDEQGFSPAEYCKIWRNVNQRIINCFCYTFNRGLRKQDRNNSDLSFAIGLLPCAEYVRLMEEALDLPLIHCDDQPLTD